MAYKTKFSTKYKKAFRDAYNNPTQYKLFVEKAKENPSIINNDTKQGVVFGYEKRMRLRQLGEEKLIFNEQDLNELIE